MAQDVVSVEGRGAEGQREGLQGVRARGPCSTSAPILKAYGLDHANHL